MIDNHKAHSEWKFQLIKQITFVSSLGKNEFCTMYIQSDNIEILIGNETDDIINDLFESLFKYKKRLETKMKGDEFVLTALIYYSIASIK